MTAFRSGFRGLTTAATTILALACGSDDEGPTGTPISIQIAANPSTLSVPQGGSESVMVTITRGSGFTGVVTLAVAGLPTGTTATVDPTQLQGTALSATVTVSVGAAVTPGTYTATITASANDVQASADVVLTVVAASDYSISATPGALIIAAGASEMTTINIDRTNFTGGVTLSLVSPPAGVTGVFSPSPSTTNASTLTLTVGASVAPSNHTLTISSSAAGLTDRSLLLQLTVVPAPTGSSDVEYAFCDPSSVPVFFAYQDGSGAWQPVAAQSSGGATRFGFNLTQGYGGVMFVARFPIETGGAVSRLDRALHRRGGALRPQWWHDGVAKRTATSILAQTTEVYLTRILYASKAELTQEAMTSCAQSFPTKVVFGTVAGVATGQSGLVSLGIATELFIGGSSANPVMFGGVQDGLVDLVGSRMVTGGSPPDRVVVFRNLNVPHENTLPSPIDFNGPASSVPAIATVTVAGGGADQIQVITEVVTATTRGRLWSDLGEGTSSVRPWAGLSLAVMAAGDLHALAALALTPAEDGIRVALKFVGPVSDQTLAFGSSLPAPLITQVAGGSYPRYRFQGSIPGEYNNGVSVQLVDPRSPGNFVGMTASTAWLSSSGSELAYDLTMPDVSGLAGFPAAARLTAGLNDGTVDTFGNIFDPFDKPSPGSDYKASMRIFTLIVP